MSSFDSIVSHQVETLNEVLREHTERRRSEILRDAQRRSDAVLRQSRRAARARVHEAVTEERRRRESALLEARQRLETEARRQVQLRYRQVLSEAWPKLNRELAGRWAQPEARAEWCELLLEEASHMLGNDGWIIEHPDAETGAWSQDNQRRLEEALVVRDIPAMEFKSDADLDAGLRIHRGGACLDGSIAGLLARRNAVEARLIAHWETAVSKSMQTPGAAGG